MALTKTPVDINFVHGLDTKADPYQVQPGHFLSLVNSVFTKTGQLTKRNGFGQLQSLPTNASVAGATFNGNLLAIGNTLNILSADTGKWFNKGSIQPMSMSVVPQVRTNTTQLTVDSVVASNGLCCTVWYDSDTHSYYRITDSVTGEVIIDTTQLTAVVSATFGPKVFTVGNYFVLVYWATAAALTYISIPIATPNSPSTTNIIGTGAAITSPFEGILAPGGLLYLAFQAAGSILKICSLSPLLVLSSLKSLASTSTPTISLAWDSSTSYVWVSVIISVGGPAKDLVFQIYDANLNVIGSPITVWNQGSITVTNLATSVTSGILTAFNGISNTYSYTPNSPGTASGKSNYTQVTTANSAGVLTGPTTLLRSVDLASKAFYLTSTSSTYVMVTYGGLMEPTYFLVDQSGNLAAKLAQSNGGGYTASTNLPIANVTGNLVQIGYLFKDLTTAVNKGTNLASGSQIAGIYNQTGINLAAFTFQPYGMPKAELAQSLHLAGGFLWQYDGVKPVEHNFHLYPEDLGTSTATGSGSLAAATYFYIATYEWTDAQGLIHRSAPSVPVKQVTTTSSSTNTVKIPTLRLTAKISPNIVRIVLYRWSSLQQTYYQITSITSPIANDLTVDSVTYTDTAADSSILGNTIIYTNGGVVEDIAAPSLTALCPYNTRLFGIDAEDQNLLWYSKQVIENTPVEMSDLFTLYVPPSLSAIGNTGPMRCLSGMDDKLVIFKNEAIFYIVGVGPDNTGSNNDFSPPVFVTATVGCSNPSSIVFTPNGLMFQSDKGIWILKRDLSTEYIGFPVEAYNSYTVVAANAIPGTNQVRFRLSNGITLMYDYFFNEWGTFNGINATSSVIYNNLETLITAPYTVYPPNMSSYTLSPQVYQETPNSYLDGSLPVLMSFQTGWISLAGLQGYERFYQALLLGNYLSPFKLNVQFSYDFISSSNQSVIVTPQTPGSIFGLAPGPFGSESPFGGNATPFKARVFPSKQKCESFQLTVNEIYDPSYGTAAGAGLTLSGLQLLIGQKKPNRTQSASRSFG